jgi:tungstate transport system substrate-binding protein
MYNDFVIIGPTSDPAKIKGMKSATDAFKKISQSGSSFVSRGDKSGTNTKELSLWKKAGIEPAGQKWYLEVGQGMEKTQRIADEKHAYTLTDRGTWLATKDKDKLDMVIVLEGDPSLFNQYGVMAVNPEKAKTVKYKESMEFVNWIISKEGQDTVAAFKDKNGNPFYTERQIRTQDRHGSVRYKRENTPRILLFAPARVRFSMDSLTQGFLRP